MASRSESDTKINPGREPEVREGERKIFASHVAPERTGEIAAFVSRPLGERSTGTTFVTAVSETLC